MKSSGVQLHESDRSATKQNNFPQVKRWKQF